MLLLGDCKEVLKQYPDNHFDLIVTDPPYGISFMGKDWDKALPDKEVWRECFRVLKEGKLALIMCSPRQDVLSRMIINLEDAGFRTNYTSIYWTFASGFPKAANISKMIDKKAGAKREVIGKCKNGCTDKSMSNSFSDDNYTWKKEFDITKPATEEAKKMEGAYVGFQPKPAVEIILVVSKGRTLTWLDDCRIPYSSDNDKDYSTSGGKRYFKSNPNGVRKYTSDSGYDRIVNPSQWDANQSNQKGRFPANLLCGTAIEYDINELLQLQQELKNA